MDYDSHTHVDEIFDDDLTNKKQEYTVVKKILIVPHKIRVNQIDINISYQKRLFTSKPWWETWWNVYHDIEVNSPLQHRKYFSFNFYRMNI